MCGDAYPKVWLIFPTDLSNHQIVSCGYRKDRNAFMKEEKVLIDLGAAESWKEIEREREC